MVQKSGANPLDSDEPGGGGPIIMPSTSNFALILRLLLSRAIDNLDFRDIYIKYKS